MMKYLPATLCSLFASMALAQEPVVTLTTEEGEEVNGTLVTIESTPSSVTDTLSLLATLNRDVDRTINLRRYELDVQDGTRNFYCWGVCYLSQPAGSMPVWESAHPVFMAPGVEVNNFHAYYKPEGVTGGSLFRFVWFDTEDTNDSTWVDVLFDAQVGIDERSALLGFDAFPNPAMDAPMSLRFELAASAKGAELVLYNALGSKVHRQPVRGGLNTVVFQRDQFQPGVYFANVELNGQALITRRLIIGSR